MTKNYKIQNGVYNLANHFIQYSQRNDGMSLNVPAC